MIHDKERTGTGTRTRGVGVVAGRPGTVTGPGISSAAGERQGVPPGTGSEGGGEDEGGEEEELAVGDDVA